MELKVHIEFWTLVQIFLTFQNPFNSAVEEFPLNFQLEVMNLHAV